MRTLVHFIVNQHKNFKVPSFINSKDMIGGPSLEAGQSPTCSPQIRLSISYLLTDWLC